MALVLALCCGAAAAAQRRALIHPAVEVPAGWVRVDGPADPAARVRVVVGLARGGKEWLEDTLWRVSLPQSPDYGAFPPRAVRRAAAGPGRGAGALVADWLVREGGARRIPFSGDDQVRAEVTRGAAERLFGGRFERFRHRRSGAEWVLNPAALSVPADLAALIDTVSGFRGFPLRPAAHAAAGTAPTVTPAVLQAQYGVTPLGPGARPELNLQAVAQFQTEFVSEQDLAAFCGRYGTEGANCSIARFVHTNVPVQPGVESMLDTEYITGLGQGTETWVYSYPNADFCAGLLEWGSDVLADARHPWVVSMSYGSQKIGFCDNRTVARLAEDVKAMAVAGVTVVISSGDDGSGEHTRQGDNDGKLSPSFPASIPYCLAVGATHFVFGTSGEEEASRSFGSGGGFSFQFPQPAYQAEAVGRYLDTFRPLPTLDWAKGGRGSPDVSALGEGFAVVVSGGTQSVDGTSASAPTWAALISLLNGVCIARSGQPLGFVNPLFYANPSMFSDIVKGTNAITPNNEGWAAIPGWDAATGLGTPRFAELLRVVNASCAARRRPR